ncbi:lysM domain receptor-like kinase 4 [Malania oleifera]|uniref:lysM domain receptor-like kinase 4 n=1 Tax=Malania oleifera TaxID=397392 RepID=UPI0025ADE445|nr:lysM domain receptor-like kinase 4 [Malania oleifera]
MRFAALFSISAFFLVSRSSLILAQQPYIRKANTNCRNTDNSTSVLGYSCIGVNSSCQAYLIFRSQPQHDSVSSISDLFASDPSQLSQINDVSVTASFEINNEVIVPVNCSCSGKHSQANTSYVIEQNDTYFLIANDTFQGLSTCQALEDQNSYAPTNLSVGLRINVPLRCACPTKTQSDAGVKNLLSYIVAEGDYVSSISERYSVQTGSVLKANGLSEQDNTIFPFTTLLIPLQNPPSRSQTITPPPPPSSLPPPPPPPSNGSSKKTWVYIIAGIVPGIALVLAISAAAYYALFRRRTDQTVCSESFESCKKPSKKLDEDSHQFLASMSSMAQSLKVYSFGELQSATENFSPKCLIKGSVYRGRFNGDWAAIKKMNRDVSKEISLLNKINHFNLICLSGISFNDGQWYLVYEYAANGPLSDWLYCSNSNRDQKSLNWTQRIHIALDVSTGLNYLHCHTIPPHVHMDLKTNNILLDSEFRAKIASFSSTRSAEGQDGQFALTRHIVGTKGYMAPEYLEHGLVSPKLDTYAFGFLMLELLTGKEAASFSGGEISKVLSAALHEEDEKQKLEDFIDPALEGTYPSELARFMIRLIDSCLKTDPAGRPGMGEIVQSLSGILTTSMTWEMSSNFSGNHSFSRSS